MMKLEPLYRKYCTHSKFSSLILSLGILLYRTNGNLIQDLKLFIQNELST